MKFEDIKEVKIPTDFDEIVYALSTADGFIERVVIYNDTIATILVEMGLASKNIRGSYGGTAALSKLYRKNDDIGVYTRFKEFCREKGIKMYTAKIVYEETK